MGEMRQLLTFRGRASARAEIAVGAIMAVLLLLGWEALARSHVVAPQFLPSPVSVVTALWSMLVSQHLLWHAAIST